MASPANFGPVPGEAAEQTPPPSATPDTLVGQEDKQASNDQEQQNKNFANAIRTLHTDLDNLARQYPEVAKAAKQCKELLTDSMVKKMSSQQGSGKAGTPPMLAA